MRGPMLCVRAYAASTGPKGFGRVASWPTAASRPVRTQCKHPIQSNPSSLCNSQATLAPTHIVIEPELEAEAEAVDDDDENEAETGGHAALPTRTLVRSQRAAVSELQATRVHVGWSPPPPRRPHGQFLGAPSPPLNAPDHLQFSSYVLSWGGSHLRSPSSRSLNEGPTSR